MELFNQIRNLLFGQEDNIEKQTLIDFYKGLKEDEQAEIRGRMMQTGGLGGFADELEMLEAEDLRFTQVNATACNLYIPLFVHEHQSEFAVRITDDKAELVWTQNDNRTLKSAAIKMLSEMAIKSENFTISDQQNTSIRNSFGPTFPHTIKMGTSKDTKSHFIKDFNDDLYKPTGYTAER